MSQNKYDNKNNGEVKSQSVKLTKQISDNGIVVKFGKK